MYMFLIVFGLACGSFVNALVWRIHEQESSKKKLKDPKLSISKGRSMCPNCHHELAAKDLVPVFSWLSLGGKCRYCKKPISWQYPLVELVTAALFVATYEIWFKSVFGDSDGLSFLILGACLLMVTGLVALFVYDLRWMILPDRVVFPLTGLAALISLARFVADDFNVYVILSSVVGAFMLGGLFYVLFAVSDGRWIGGGDVKLGIMMGILLGPILAYFALLVASLAGSVIILGLMAFNVINRKQQVPFGPFLITGTYLALIYGSQIIEWYSDKFLGGML